MLDHVFVSVSDLDRSIAFYEKALAPLGIRHAIDYDGANGPEGHPDLKDAYLPRSKRSRFITFVHAATKSCTNFCCASPLA